MSSATFFPHSARPPARPQIEQQLTAVWKPLEALTIKQTTAAALAIAIAAPVADASNGSAGAGAGGGSDDASAMGGNGVGAGGDAWMVWDVMGELSRVALQQQNYALARETATKAAAARSIGLRYFGHTMSQHAPKQVAIPYQQITRCRQKIFFTFFREKCGK